MHVRAFRSTIPVRMSELDESQEALRNVEQITESEPVNGEELVTSEELKRQFREAKERLDSEPLR